MITGSWSNTFPSWTASDTEESVQVAQLQEEIQDKLAELQGAPSFQAVRFEQDVAEMHDLVRTQLAASHRT